MRRAHGRRPGHHRNHDLADTHIDALESTFATIRDALEAAGGEQVATEYAPSIAAMSADVTNNDQVQAVATHPAHSDRSPTPESSRVARTGRSDLHQSQRDARAPNCDHDVARWVSGGAKLLAAKKGIALYVLDRDLSGRAVVHENPATRWRGRLLAVRLARTLAHVHERPGVALRDAVEQAALERLAPILMTALAAGLGLVPLALSAGVPGSEIQAPMALVILCGLASSTALNMFVVPGQG